MAFQYLIINIYDSKENINAITYPFNAESGLPLCISQLYMYACEQQLNLLAPAQPVTLYFKFKSCNEEETFEISIQGTE